MSKIPKTETHEKFEKTNGIEAEDFYIFLHYKHKEGVNNFLAAIDQQVVFDLLKLISTDYEETFLNFMDMMTNEMKTNSKGGH